MRTSIGRSAQVNKDENVVRGFSEEWSRFTQAELPNKERQAMFDAYFSVFPWERLPPDAVGADIGCGSGRWAVLLAPRVGELHLVDASEAALGVAKRNLAGLANVRFHLASVGTLPFNDGSLDFVYSLGVLHHVPDTAAAVRGVAQVLKPGAPLLLYLYYAFDNRPLWFRALWRTSDCFRLIISRLPRTAKYGICDVIAALVYWPLARMARLLERLGRLPPSFPLAYYRDLSFYVMRTDALDRFGTRLEQRFTREQIEAMLRSAGMERIHFSESAPFWCVSAIRCRSQ